jgi:miniconductance mechanosensitive channel
MVLAYAIDYLAKKILIIGLAIVATYTKSTFDDFLVANKTAKYIAHLVPLYYISIKIPIVLDDFVYWENLFGKSVKIFIIILSLFIVRSVFNSLKDYLKTLPKYNDKPIDSYIQVIMIVLWIYALLSIILLLFDTKKSSLLTAFGSISALIILGFVASIQVTVNDMVRIGDWITVDKFGADGEVEEINLATVKVRNFDNTTSTIPTYSLISDSFRNWRGMINSDGRRIKRHILIKGATVRFVTNEELESFKRIQFVANYIDKKKLDIDKFNMANNIDKSLNVNGRNMTNLGLFRKYIQKYIETHPGINKDMHLLVRHLQPTEKGIPLEIYCFSKDKKWENYEYIMADIFDHIIASVPYFDLELFEVQHVKAEKLNLLDIE